MKILLSTLFILLYTVNVKSESNSDLVNKKTTQSQSSILAVGSGFNYQGELVESGIPVNGDHQFIFRLYDSSIEGTIVGADVTMPTTVVNGLFSIDNIDFGDAVYAGDELWLSVWVDNIELNPRQRINSVPYAVQSEFSNSESTLWESNGNDINYKQGRVSIGTTTIIAALLVEAQEGDVIRARVNGLTKFNVNENGGVSIGGIFAPAANGLEIVGQTQIRSTIDANLSNDSGGLIVGSESGSNLAFDGNEILARDNGSAATLHLGQEGGVFLSAGGSTSTSNGILSIGPTGDEHIAIDGDEIQSKNGNDGANLSLNIRGGNIRFGSPSSVLTFAGDVKQPISSNGLIKAMVVVRNCGIPNPASPFNPRVIRQYNGVNNTTISVARTGDLGSCEIDFPFDVSQRFWHSSMESTGSLQNTVNCRGGTSNDKLICSVTSLQTSNPTATSTGIHIFVY